MPWLEQRDWAAWQALVADASGARINSAGNPVHFTGIVWAGGHGLPLDAAPPAGEVSALSGACLAIPRADLGGGRRVPRALLPLPRGRRPLAAPAAARRRAWDRAHRGRRSRLRVRRRGAEVALAGAQPLGIPDPRLPGEPASRSRPGPPRHRAGADLGVDAGEGGAGRSSRPTLTSCAGCRACCASGARCRPPARLAPPTLPPGSAPTSIPPSSRRSSAAARLACSCDGYWRLARLLLKYLHR